MTATKTDRRGFLGTTVRTGVSVCGVCFCSRLPAFAESNVEAAAPKALDPKKLEFCGYSCPPDCKFRKGTLENDLELKKQAWVDWKIEERFGVEFDPEQAICYGCKATAKTDKPEGIVLKRCDVRACAQEKKLESCIECQELEGCDKDLWRRFPDFKKQVVEMQKQYASQ